MRFVGAQVSGEKQEHGAWVSTALVRLPNPMFRGMNVAPWTTFACSSHSLAQNLWCLLLTFEGSQTMGIPRLLRFTAPKTNDSRVARLPPACVPHRKELIISSEVPETDDVSTTTSSYRRGTPPPARNVWLEVTCA